MSSVSFYTGLQSKAHPTGWKFSRRTRDLWIIRYNLSWLEVKDLIMDAMLDHKEDFNLIQDIAVRTAPFIPVRSGTLANHIFKTMFIARVSWYSTVFLDLYYDYPKEYPLQINNPAHSYSRGYGPWGTAEKENPYIHITVLIDYITAGGNAMYILNDPNASVDFMKRIADTGEQVLFNHLQTIFLDIIITITI